MTDASDFQDPYIDPATGLLRNLVGALTKEALSDAEGDLAFTRLVQLMDRPPAATGDLAELQAVHRHLFQDVYAWAGEIRTVDVRKNVEGAEFFLPVSMIARASRFAAEELRTEKMLLGIGRSQFIKRLSYHYEQFNYIHPFREGNGRTQRVFWNRIAVDAGWQLDWRPSERACHSAGGERTMTPATRDATRRPTNDMLAVTGQRAYIRPNAAPPRCADNQHYVK